MFNEELIYKYLTGNSTNEETDILLQWLNQNSNNREQFAALKKVFIETEEAMSDSSGITEEAYQKFLERVHLKESQEKAGAKVKPPVFNRFSRYAAILILALTIGTIAYYIGKNNIKKINNEFCEIRVPYGGKSNLLLPDKTKIWLNAGSKLRYNKSFDNNKREVYLEGEAYFNVEKSNSPFIVHTSHLDLQVLGTVFNVKSYPDENNIETTLIEGKVCVKSDKTKKPIYLNPNQKLTFYKKEKCIETTDLTDSISNTNTIAEESKSKETIVFSNINTEKAISWKTGTLIFESEPLISITKKLERKFDVQFIFENEEMKQYTYSGTLKDFPLEQVLEALKLTSALDYSINKKNVSLFINNHKRTIYEQLTK